MTEVLVFILLQLVFDIFIFNALADMKREQDAITKDFYEKVENARKMVKK